MTERDMRPAVDAWLRQRRCAVLHEVLMLGNCDVVGVRFSERTGRLIPSVELAVAVELKVADVASVIWQAQEHVKCVHESYAAMPGLRCDAMRSVTLNRFRAAGVGLLAIDSGHVEVIVIPRTGNWDERLRKRLWRRLREIGKLKTGRRP